MKTNTAHDKNQNLRVWILIPARGNSKGIPRKNLKSLNNIPLIYHVLQTASKAFAKKQIIVSTDSDEIAQLSQKYAVIHARPADFAQDASTLDEVAVNVAHWLLEHGADEHDILLTIQPTSPFLSDLTIQKGVDLLKSGAGAVLTVKDDRHLRWTTDAQSNAQPLFTARVNRQWLPPILAETGGIIGTHIHTLLKTGTRINAPISLLEIDRREGLDIDSYADWAIAEYYARRKKIVIRSDASPLLGMGHAYRALALASELNEHKLEIVTRADGEYALGFEFLDSYPYSINPIQDDAAFLDFLDQTKPDLVILDVLDTDETTMLAVKARTQKVVSLEDLGAGASLADIVINDLYTDFYPQENHWYGVRNAILGPQFEMVAPRPFLNAQVGTILIAFGGTDPNNLTAKALAALAQINFSEDVLVILGPGYSHGQIDLATYGLTGQVLRSVTNMPQLMQQADLALTSGGRTVTELMSMGVPTLVLCQNNRELRHTHASSPYGVINLGLGEHVETTSLAKHVSMLLNDIALLESMQKRALKAVGDRSNKQIVARILNTLFE